MTEICLAAPARLLPFDAKAENQAAFEKALRQETYEDSSNSFRSRDIVINRIEYDDRTSLDAKSEKLFADGLEKIKQAFQDIGPEEREHHLREMAEEFGLKHRLIPARPSPLRSAVSLPSKPPALWLRDRLPDETPPEFIMRFYRPYVGKGLTRAFFLQKGQDGSLYTALRKYLKKAKEDGIALPKGFNLPSQREIGNLRVKQLGVSSASEAWKQAIQKAPDEIKDLLHAYEMLRQRQTRTRPSL